MLPSITEAVLKELEAEREQEIISENSEAILPTEKRSLAILREEGLFLYNLVRAMKAKFIIEIGTSFGYSTIWLAAAAKEENGRVISFDILPEKIEKATENLTKAGLINNVELILGDVRNFMKETSIPLDLVFLDADKRDYPEFIALSIEKLRTGGILLSDNVLDCPEIHKDDPEICFEIMELVQNHPKCSSVTIPFLPNGLEMTLKRTN